MSTTTRERLRRKATKAGRKVTEEDRREAAAREARRRWEEIRAAVSARAEDLAEAAEEQWEHARDVAAPRVDHLRKRAAEVFDTDLDRIRGEVGDVVGDVRRAVVGLGVDVKDASRAEADRIIRAIHETAEEAREAERRRRVRALVGWTAFGMVAGAVLALQLGPKRDRDEPDAMLPDEVPGAVDGDPVDVAEDEGPVSPS
jgi:hypothetical protein